MTATLPSVTVIVPAYNAAATLTPCLTALKAQTYPEALRTIIVVDDGSTDNTKQIAAELGVEIVGQSNQGAASARNLGARKADTDLILFTDSDCEPLGDWLAKMVAPFSDPQVVGAKGFYLTRQSSLTAKFVQAEYEIKCRGLDQRDSIDFIDTFSAAYRRAVFLDSGGFDGAYLGAGAEDVELSYRLSAKGLKLVAAPGAYVLHRHPETIGEYFRRKCRYAYWRAVAWQKHPHKAVRDSYTPNAQKLEVLLAPLVIFNFVGMLGWPGAFWKPFVGLMVLFMLNEHPYFVQARHDLSLFCTVPVFTLMRGMAGMISLGARLIEIALSRPLGSFKFLQ